MIIYDSQAWTSQIFRFTGTVWPSIWKGQLLITIYICCSYMFCVNMGSNLGKLKGNYLGGILSFLLVFRANQSYSRFWQGRTLVTDFFCDLREVIVAVLAMMPGGSRSYKWRWATTGMCGQTRSRELAVELDENTDIADSILSEERVDIVRWALVVAISLQLHARIVDELERGDLSADVKWLVNWDRFRIRCLTTRLEFQDLDRFVSGLAIPQDAWQDSLLDDPHGFYDQFCKNPYPDPGAEVIEVSTDPTSRLPSMTVHKLLQVLIRNVNDQRIMDKAYGLAEMFFPSLCGRMLNLNMILSKITQIIATPLPFPYFHLCKCLLFVYFLSFPFFIDIGAGIWANVGEVSCLTMALLGLDSIATELENPFGCDDNDLCIADDVYRLEQEMLWYAQHTGDTRVGDSFSWQPTPPCIAELSALKPANFVVLASIWESNGDVCDPYPFPRIQRTMATEGDTSWDDDDDMSDDS